MRVQTITEDLVVTAESFSNSRNWGHEVRAIYQGREVMKHKSFYLNRTWERYQFESALLHLVDKLDSSKAIPLKDRIAFYQFIRNNNNF